MSNIRRNTVAFLLLIGSFATAQEPSGSARPIVKFATFNVALHRRSADQLTKDLRRGASDPAKRLAEIIQRVRPDVLLLNEIDDDDDHKNIATFCEQYLAVPQGGQEPIDYPHRFVAGVNTGVPTGLDLDGDGRNDGPADAFGYGDFPGQYGMAVVSRLPIDFERVRTFQKFLWKDMPGAMLPRKGEGSAFYPDQVMQKFRLSSKSHWDVPILVNGQPVHFLVSHPTPPVFDGPEDRNGTRNHDEIRFWADYVDPARSAYVYDDLGVTGGLPAGSRFVIAGDLNADPFDGDNTHSPMDHLFQHTLIRGDLQPASRGGIAKAKRDGEANMRHRGNPAHDTGDFSDRRTGNLRIDFVLPSKNLTVVECGVFWPEPNEEGGELVTASDHRLVWIDVSNSPAEPDQVPPSP